MKNLRTKYTIVATFLAMLIMAITESTRGILIPTFKDTFGVSDTTIGTFLVLVTLSYIVATYFASSFCTKYGQKKTIMLGMVIAGLGFLAASFSQNFIHIILGYGVVTSGTAFILIGMNTIIPLLNVAYLGVLMNTLHFFYGFGATLTQRLTGYLLFIDVSWRTIFVGYFGLYIIGILVYSFVKPPQHEEEHKDKSKGEIANKKLMLLFSLALGFYVASEIQTSNWLLNYLQEAYKFNSDKGSVYVAAFFGIFSVGRLLGGFVVEKVGYLKSVIISMSVGFVLYLAGLLMGEGSIILVSISGLFFAVTYPTLMLVLQKTYKTNTTRVVGIVSMVSSAVSMLIGYLIGVFNDVAGVKISIYLLPFSLLLSIFLTIMIAVEVKRLKGAEKHA